jgi:hypothetical protein
MSLSHWGIFDARDVPFAYWPLKWANSVDTEAHAEFFDT